jgi:hypothetical protein
MLKIHKYLLALVAFALVASCKTSQPTQALASTENQSQMTEKQSINMALPSTFIYKTKADYSQLVPVLVSSETKVIYSYPDKKDLLVDGKLRLPSPLLDGYLLDNKGISKDAAFLKLTYAQYVALEQTPSSKELQEMVLDYEPFIELYECKKTIGADAKVYYFNQLIKQGQLQTQCVRLK